MGASIDLPEARSSAAAPHFLGCFTGPETRVQSIFILLFFSFFESQAEFFECLLCFLGGRSGSTMKFVDCAAYSTRGLWSLLVRLAGSVSWLACLSRRARTLC